MIDYGSDGREAALWKGGSGEILSFGIRRGAAVTFAPVCFVSIDLDVEETILSPLNNEKIVNKNESIHFLFLYFVLLFFN